MLFDLLVKAVERTHSAGPGVLSQFSRMFVCLRDDKNVHIPVT